MIPTPEISREFLEQAIDTAIEASEEAIQAEIKSRELLKLRRNALQPISALPPEIFAAIFSSLCLPGIPSLGGKPSRNLTRLHMSHVCHQWREIALNQSQLWSHIDFNTVSLAGATEILVRAKSVPLYMETSVSRQYDNDRFGQFLNQVQAYLPQIRHLSIKGELEFLRTIYGGLENTLVSPAPTLEYLSLSFQDENRKIADDPLFIPNIQLLNTLLGGSTPRLSCLKLRDCNINHNSPLLKSLTYLELITPYGPYYMTRPKLAVWLDTLDNIPQLKMLTLRSAFPVAPQFPFGVERTVVLPYLTHLDISGSLRDCALASAHLVLPALTSLCLTATDFTNGSDVQTFLPYVAQHVHGSQDIQPLRSVLIRQYEDRLGLLAWPVPDIGTFVHDPPAFLGATLTTRVNISFRSDFEDVLKIFQIMMAALSLDGLVTLAAVDLPVDLLKRPGRSRDYQLEDLTTQQFWLRLLPNWPLLQHARLAHIMSSGFVKALLEDCKNPLLPSLTELALAETTLDAHQMLCLRDMLMKRAEQGVALKTLDLRMCRRDPYNLIAVQLLSEIAIDIIRPLDFLGPEDTEESRDAGYLMFVKMLTMWEPFLPYPCYSGNEDYEFEESEDEGDDDDEDEDERNDEDSNGDEYNDDDEEEDEGDNVSDDD